VNISQLKLRSEKFDDDDDDNNNNNNNNNPWVSIKTLKLFNNLEILNLSGRTLVP
jgi:hypothetical protein